MVKAQAEEEISKVEREITPAEDFATVKEEIKAEVEVLVAEDTKKEEKAEKPKKSSKKKAAVVKEENTESVVVEEKIEKVDEKVVVEPEKPAKVSPNKKVKAEVEVKTETVSETKVEEKEIKDEKSGSNNTARDKEPAAPVVMDEKALKEAKISPTPD